MPDFYLFGGPNGAGKTTLASTLLPALGVREFVNADLIAQGLSPFCAEAVAREAGVVMLRRVRELSNKGAEFGTESTLAARTFVPLVRQLRAQGYTFKLIYVWPCNVELSIARVAARVRAGGHDIPEATIRRRFEAGRHNLRNLYLPLADHWVAYDNAGDSRRIVAAGGLNLPTTVYHVATWQSILS